MISEQLRDVLNKIAESKQNEKEKTKKEAKLIAVSKTKPADMVLLAYQENIRDFGENKVQEMVQKYEILPKDIRWHMIGHLQTNKVKYIAPFVYMIHSVDSLKLANEISRQALIHQRIIPILIEVNAANEDTKFGVHVNECMPLVREMAKLPGIRISGLMTIAPFTDKPETNRVYFQALRQLSVDIKNENIDNVYMDELSMGMTIDYDVAVEEGATYVRVGTAIFGERDYSVS